ncbi:twin-arginine translocase subunit TatC [Timonella senegalensis]|uniref:twin-arginine translocase subunit TatC n=1 Tax=Timonella senegalensis TaxID=1465825 RepID=UPI0028AB272D|nr:twin-arginine translocase subunit TatC [Timonella senegalensis]
MASTTSGQGPSPKDIRRATRARRKTERNKARSEMSLLEHFKELKNRLFLAAVGIVMAAIVGWFLFTPVFNSLQQPLLDAAERTNTTISVNFGGVATALDMRIKMAFFIGLFISSPWWIYQLWSFVTPGLSKKERGYTYGFIGAAVPLFLAGALLAWLVLPHAVDILTAFVPEGAANLLAADVYLSFVMKLLIAFGLAFVMPVLLVMLNFLGMLSAKSLLAAWRWAIVVAFTFAAIMTPTPDALTMILVAIPIVVLYFAAVGIAYLHDKREAKRMVELDQELEGY